MLLTYHFFATLNQYQELCESRYGRMGSLAAPNSHCVLCGRKAMLPLNCSQGIFMVRSASRMTEIESEAWDCVGDSANETF